MADENTDLVLIASIGAPQGIRGEIRLNYHGDDPGNLNDYGALCNSDETRWFEIKSLRIQNYKVIVRFEHINDRNQAEKLTGTELYVPRHRFPETDDNEYYHVDLIGLDAITVNGREIGKVVAIVDFGAGDLIEISAYNSNSFYIPFRRETVTEVNLKGGFITVDPPEGLVPDIRKQKKVDTDPAN